VLTGEVPEREAEAEDRLDDPREADPDEERGDHVRDEDADTEADERPQREREQAERERAQHLHGREGIHASGAEHRRADADRPEQADQPVADADDDERDDLREQRPAALRDGEEGARDRLVPVLRPDLHDADRQEQQVPDAQPGGVDGVGDLGVVTHRDGHPVLRGGTHVHRVEEAEERGEEGAGDEDRDRHAPPEPGGAELEELGADSLDHSLAPSMPAWASLTTGAGAPSPP
jgi:hypothetical protein